MLIIETYPITSLIITSLIAGGSFALILKAAMLATDTSFNGGN